MFVSGIQQWLAIHTQILFQLWFITGYWIQFPLPYPGGFCYLSMLYTTPCICFPILPSLRPPPHCQAQVCSMSRSLTGFLGFKGLAQLGFNCQSFRFHSAVLQGGAWCVRSGEEASRPLDSGGKDGPASCWALVHLGWHPLICVGCAPILPPCSIHQWHPGLITAGSNVSQTWSEPGQPYSNICQGWKKTPWYRNINVNQANTLLCMLYPLTLTSIPS